MLVAGWARAVMILTVLMGSPGWPPTAELPAAGESFVIVQPGYPGSTEDATEFVKRLAAVLAELRGTAPGEGAYHNDETGGLAAIREREPAFGIVSLGFCLEHAEQLSLAPLLWSEPDEPFRVLARPGTLTSLGDLARHSLTGTPLVEEGFVRRILFAGKGGDAALPDCEIVPARFFSRAVRNVTKGRQDAVIVSDREYRGLQRLDSAAELEVIHTTGAYPAAVVVAFGERLGAEPRQQLANAFLRLGESDTGRELLQEMGIGGFREVDAKRYDELRARYASKPIAPEVPPKKKDAAG